MKIQDLPVGNAPAPIEYPYFPTRWQHFIWRNWELIEPEKIASVLKCSRKELFEAVAEMGLNTQPDVLPKWKSHGYLTLIRNNWHLLNYPQLLELLDWTPEQLAYTLKEEDFCFTKLGALKPDCPELKYEPLTEPQKKQTAELKAVFQKHFPATTLAYKEPPFAFADAYAARETIIGNEKFEFNFIHSYAANCGDVLGCADELDPVPENLMEQYASMGIKGVWMHAILYLLIPIPGAEEYSAGREKRMQNLKNIVARCKKYGLKIYLYLNEPRCLPLSFYEKKPHWTGIDVTHLNTKTICTTAHPEPLQWLEGAMKTLFTEVPDLGGVLTITMSENPTHCNYKFNKHECPSCKNVPQEKIIAGVISAMERGMHAAAPEAKMLCYDWAWRRNPEDNDVISFKKDVLDNLPKDIYVTSVSEWGMTTKVGGVEQYLVDYSISQVGPSEEAREVWKYALKNGIGVAAKLQINNSWEISAVPYIPVPYLIQEHLKNLKECGVQGLMLSWTQGGFPGGNLELLNATPEEIAAGKYHPELAEEVCKAWKIFSDSFREFPFNVTVIYKAPMNFGPMNQLHLRKTNYKATMIGYPYDDLKTWRSVYPEDVFENQFKILTAGWLKGLQILEKAESMVTEKESAEFHELRKIATAAYCHLRSTYLQIRFVRSRDNAFDKNTMIACVKEEIELAHTLHDIILEDSRIGFEASNHYYYSPADLREKVINCEYILRELSK